MKNKKTWLIVLISIFVVLGIGLGVYFFLNIKENNNDDDSEEIVEPKKEEKEEKNNDSKEIKPLLYKVTKDGSENVIYLFGSIHVADDRAYPLRNEIIEAYNNSDYLAVEFDMISYQKNISAQMEDTKMLMAEGGLSLSDYLSKKTYDKLITYLKDNNAYSALYENYKPVMLYSVVSNVAYTKSGLDGNKGIDMYFLKKAHDENKNILEVESSSYQYTLLSSFSDEFYDYLITNSITFEKLMISNIKKTYEGWLYGKDDAIIENDPEEIEVDDSESKSLLDEYKQFNYKLINVRNKEMFNTIEGYFNSNKKVFVVVGVGHIVGNSGVREEFKKNGYNVELIEYK